MDAMTPELAGRENLPIVGPARCSTCPNFDALNKACRANPPMSIVTERGVMGFWAPVKESDWCGAHPANQGRGRV